MAVTARRLLSTSRYRLVPPTVTKIHRFLSFDDSESVGVQSPKLAVETPRYANVSSSATNASSSSGVVSDEKDRLGDSQKSDGVGGGKRVGVGYQEEHARVLEASLKYVVRFPTGDAICIAYS